MIVNESTHHRLKDPAHWYCVSLKILMTLLGIVLGIGGLWLIALGETWFDLLGGLGLVISGTGMANTSSVGMWAYLLSYLFTLGWTFWGIETDWSSLAPRLVALIVLQASVLFCISLLKPRGDAHARDRSTTLMGFSIVAGVLLTPPGTLSVVAQESNGMPPPAAEVEASTVRDHKAETFERTVPDMMLPDSGSYPAA